MSEANEVDGVVMRHIDRLINPPLILEAGTVHAQLHGEQITRAFAVRRKWIPSSVYWLMWSIMHDA